MSWFRIDDAWHSHPKVIAAGNAAAGLWARCGTYCAAHDLEGRIPAHVARQFGTRAEIARLVAVGLWVAHDDLYVMPDWLDYNPSAEQQKAKRKADADRQRRAREAAASRRDTGRDIHRDNGASNAVSNGPPDPTRPVVIQVTDISTPVDTPDAGGKPVDIRRNTVADAYANIATNNANGINNPNAYKHRARQTALNHPDLDRYLTRWPDAPPTAIAAWLHGDKHSMAYYHDTEDQT